MLLYSLFTVNSLVTVSVSKNTNFCRGLEENDKCYKNFLDPKGLANNDVNAVCLDSNNSNSLGYYCGFTQAYLKSKYFVLHDRYSFSIIHSYKHQHIFKFPGLFI